MNRPMFSQRKLSPISLVLPALVTLGSVHLLPEDLRHNFPLLLEVAAIGALIAGFCESVRFYQKIWACLWYGLLFSGAIFTLNCFVIFTGCIMIDRNPGTKAASRREMAKVARMIPQRDPQATKGMVDLTPYYNAALTENWRTEYSDRNLASLPIGLQTLAGVEFDVRGVIRTCSQPRRDFGRRFPPVINGLKINRKCQYLYFLDGTGWKAPDQYPIASYIIHYADGQQREIVLVYGRDLLTSWIVETDRSESENQFKARGGKLAWTESHSPTHSTPKARLFLGTWENPRPDTLVDHVDLVSNNRVFVTHFLIAITAK